MSAAMDLTTSSIGSELFNVVSFHILLLIRGADDDTGGKGLSVVTSQEGNNLIKCFALMLAGVAADADADDDDDEDENNQDVGSTR